MPVSKFQEEDEFLESVTSESFSEDNELPCPRKGTNDSPFVRKSRHFKILDPKDDKFSNEHSANI
jgi:hypothetical protein